MKEKIDHLKDPRNWATIEQIIREKSGVADPFKYPLDIADSKPESHAKRIATTTDLDPYAGDWDDRAITHLLRRVMFGSKMSDLESFRSMSVAGSIDQLIQESPVPTPPTNDYSEEDTGVPFGESWVLAPADQFEYERIMSLNAWTLNNFIDQEQTIHEKMILFWHNLLPTQAMGVFVAKASYQYFSMLRRNALGNFKTLIKELTLDTSMLLYLNGAWNNKWAPDENYSRELQELFTLGKGPNSQYTESDVQEGAKLLTGFTLNWEDRLNEGTWDYFFNPDWHSTANKRFSSFYGDEFIQGRSGMAGAEELDEMLDMIFNNEETALYICRRIYNFFVYSEIDESVEQNVIEPLAAIFRENDYEIVPVLKALFSSEHFFDEANRGAMIKSPIEHFVGYWRTIEIEHVDPEDAHLVYNTMTSVYWGYLYSTGQRIGDPPSVSGWPAYYQAPTYDKNWITTDSITRRASSLDALVFGWFWVNDPDYRLAADFVKFAEALPNPANPNTLISDTLLLLSGMESDQDTLDYLKSVLLTGQATDGYWTGAWNDYQADPSAANREIIESRLRGLFRSINHLSESHLM